jgi:hypothetical protein
LSCPGSSSEERERERELRREKAIAMKQSFLYCFGVRERDKEWVG